MINRNSYDAFIQNIRSLDEGGEEKKTYTSFYLSLHYLYIYITDYTLNAITRVVVLYIPFFFFIIHMYKKERVRQSFGYLY